MGEERPILLLGGGNVDLAILIPGLEKHSNIKVKQIFNMWWECIKVKGSEQVSWTKGQELVEFFQKIGLSELYWVTNWNGLNTSVR